MKFNRLLLAATSSLLLVSCGSNPIRVSASDIPSWCNDIEATGIFSNLTPEIITGEKLLACGSGSANEISSARDKATIDAKNQILDQLIGRLIKKYSEDRLVDNYRDRLSYSSFGYDIIEQEVFDIEGGYQTFILIETMMDDLKGTQQALLKSRFQKTSEELVSDK
jgi:hypothetical protein